MTTVEVVTEDGRRETLAFYQRLDQVPISALRAGEKIALDPGAIPQGSPVGSEVHLGTQASTQIGPVLGIVIGIAIVAIGTLIIAVAYKIILTSARCGKRARIEDVSENVAVINFPNCGGCTVNKTTGECIESWKPPEGPGGGVGKGLQAVALGLIAVAAIAGFAALASKRRKAG